MSAYNFQKQFVPLIESGVKKSTIRARRKNGYLPKVGEVLGLWNGMRTKSCRLIRRVTVTRVTPICINTSGTIGAFPEVILGMDRLPPARVADLAMADGFDHVDDFRDFFHHNYGAAANLYMIEWD